jgi:hypothetical protein
MIPAASETNKVLNLTPGSINWDIQEMYLEVISYNLTATNDAGSWCSICICSSICIIYLLASK